MYYYSIQERVTIVKHALDVIIDSFKNDIVSEVVKLIRINSEKSTPLPGMPFGAGIGVCLEETLNLCSRLGFRTKNCDGYVGYAEIGEGKELIGILVHLDVVPAGNGWRFGPFDGEISDGRIYGRGTIDDKGPAVAAIYAAKALAESGLHINRRVRLIFGTDEENKWECMDYYKANEELPDMGFSPDAEFPVIFAEKGILFVNLEHQLQTNADEMRIVKLEGGERANMVPGVCHAEIAVPDRLKSVLQTWFCSAIARDDVTGVLRDGVMSLETCGLSAHGSTPEKGVNAISAMMEVLGSLKWLSEDQLAFVRFYNERLGRETCGHSFIGKAEDEISGSLVLNAGVLHIDCQSALLKINIRYPVSYKGEEIITGIKNALKGSGITAVVDLNSEPLYQQLESSIVNTLLSVYHSYNDDATKPLCVGGGTYARSMPNSVAFGPVFPGQAELAHCPDEYISVDDLMLNAKIYAEALRRLVE